MLGWQWQLEKFEGENTGSLVSLHVTSNWDGISKVIFNKTNIIDYNKEIPLDVFVERRNIEVTTQNGDGDSELDLHVKLGLQFQRELEVLLADILPQVKKFKVPCIRTCGKIADLALRPRCILNY